ncbi:MAG TPA: sensor domain-containing diguanylate cyclase [Rhodocyclaceae bacterium]|nr:sensor domain-containing diguanylate cyclase [Rhodocyclaceae bacterium]
MPIINRLFNQQRLILLLGLLLSAGFMATSLISYVVSRDSIRASIIDRELPLTSDNVYTEIQKDLVRPIFVSSMMASDTFLRDWVLRGEKNVNEMTRYLREVQERYGAFTAFFISEKTSAYYQNKGILKHVSQQDPHDAWYYTVRGIQPPYKIDVDTDQANANKLTIFINYRVFDYQKNFIGVAGIGLTVDSVRQLIANYQQRYQRNIYFVDQKGHIVLFGNQSGHDAATNIRDVEGLNVFADRIFRDKSGSYQYTHQGSMHMLNVRFIPELNWYLFVEKLEDEALSPIRHTLYLNLAICLLITAVVLLFTWIALNHYQRRLQEMASTDKLTGLYNRQVFDILMEQALNEYQRQPKPISLLLVDVDHFKRINDRYGHLEGDHVLRELTPLIRSCLRRSDLAFRWGGEEYLIMLRGSTADAAVSVAEKLRAAVAEHRFLVASNILNITISVGVAEYAPGDTADVLVSRADEGLYAAKNLGRNKVVASSANTLP